MVQFYYQTYILVPKISSFLISQEFVCCDESIIPYSANIFTCVTLSKAGLVLGPLRLSVRPSVRPQHFWGAEFV